MAIATLGNHTGSVTSFDDHRGLGVITGDNGRTYPFHCTGIADGSRTIDEAASVQFDVVAGRLGQWEASGITTR